MRRTLFRESQGCTSLHHLLLGKRIRQRLQEIGRTTLVGMLAHIVRLLDVLLEETHLAPQVVTLTPADEILYLRLPSAAVSHIEHACLQIGYHVGTEREVLVDSVLGYLRKIRILLTQDFSQAVSLGAIYQTGSHTEVLDIGLQLLAELIVVGAIHRNLIADFSFGNGAEVDSAQRTVGQHLGEITLSLLDSGRGIPVETYGDTLGDALGSHSCLSILITWIKGEAHDTEMLVADTFQGIKLVNLVERSIEEVAFGFCRTHHEGRVGHIRIYLLYNEIIRSLALILVGTLAHHFLLPLLLTLQVFLVTLTDILHDHRNRHLHTTFTCACTCKEAGHQGGFVLHIVDISESRIPKMGSQRRENGVRHSRLINLRRLRDQQFHQLRQLLGHRRWRRIRGSTTTLNFEI